MASIAGSSPFAERRGQERRRLAYPPVQRAVSADGLRVSWGGVWGGVLSATGLLMLVTALGVAIGISAADPSSTDMKTLGTGAGIYAGVSLLLALFVGGMVSTRIGAIFDSTTGFVEGALVWVVSVLLIGYLAGSGIGAVAGGAFKMIGGATQAIGSVMQGSGASQGSDPAQAAQQAKQSMGDLKEKASGALQQKTEEAKQKAEEVKPAATKAAWITFGALVLSLLAAVGGAMLGRRQPTSMGT